MAMLERSFPAPMTAATPSLSAIARQTIYFSLVGLTMAGMIWLAVVATATPGGMP